MALDEYPNQESESYYPQTPPPKKSIKIWLFVLLFIGIVAVGLLAFLFFNSSPKTISEDKLLNGINTELKGTEETKFMLYDQEHTIAVDAIDNDSVTLIIQSNPIRIAVSIGEERKLDLNDDGIYDIQLKLITIKNGIPNLFIKKISEKICVENWSCNDWTNCTIYSNQTRTCSDLNSCGTTKDKPVLVQTCTYVKEVKVIAKCLENWNCGNWSSCANSQQNRTCVDLNHCNTTENKSSILQSCVVQVIDCGTNIQNVTENIPNYDCFIAASINCDYAKLLSTGSVDVFGVNVTATSKFELQGMNSNRCVFYQRMENYSVKFMDYAVQQFLAQGMNQSEIDGQEQNMTANAQQFVGKYRTCKFNKENLTATLTRWRDGIFNVDVSCTLDIAANTSNCTTGGDYAGAECFGDY
ncbi:MAG: hypothetical protein PHU12_04280 [Candidatus Aenigmarchaeota archaeon]|nr:hypothetical protein [Candidatus Aenigmarchaeota archaeon]